MEDGIQPSLEDVRYAYCPRCLQPVPPKASRCPGCRQPIHPLRLLPWAIGAASLLALVFALLLVFRMVRNEGLNAPVPVDDSAAKQGELFPDPPPADKNPKQPAKPEKRPPLNER